MTTARNCHLSFLGWSPTNPRMVTLQRDLYYRQGIWYLDLSHETDWGWWSLTLKNWFLSKLFNTGVGAQSSSTLKSAVSAIFLHTNQQKTFQRTLGTQDHTSIVSKTILGPSMDPTRPLKWTLWILRKFRDFWENFRFFYILYSLAPLTMLEHLFGHCPTVPRLRGPSWTFMDPQMDP